jgi:hypothetical protein
MTIFTMKDGKLSPIAIVKSGKTIDYAEFMKASESKPAAEPAKEATKAEPAKDAPKGEMKK